MIRKKIRVLIIEDSRLYQRFLQQVIESDDCLSVVGIADSGSRALELIPSLAPDVITLDLQLPDCDGLVLLTEILDRWTFPVVVVSGDPEACAAAIALGAQDCIEKMQDAEPKTAAQFRLLDNKFFVAVIEHATQVGHNNLLSGSHVGGSTYNLRRSFTTEVNSRHMQMVTIGMYIACKHLAHIQSLEATLDGLHLF